MGRNSTYCKDCEKGVCKIHSEPPGFDKRKSWDDYFMGLAESVATRSTCLRHNLGAVLVKDRRILATGYNGAPRGLKHCLETGCLRDKLKIASGTRHEICMAVHAEQNAIIQAASHGAPTEGSEIFITHAPCAVCVKILINAGVKRIVFKNHYPDDFAKKLLKQAKIKVDCICGETQTPKIVLGFVGNFCAGKGQAISYLVEKHGFLASSCSDRIREEATKKGLKLTRENLQKLAGEMRQKSGVTILVEKTWQSILKKKAEYVAIDSIMSIEEVNFLQKIPNFHLVMIDADQKLRYKRMVERGRGDPVIWNDFVKAEKKNLEEDGRNLKACFAAADFKIKNNGTTEELNKKIDKLLKKMEKSN